MRRVLGTVLVVAGLALLADVALTLAWQEPISALRARSAQRTLAHELRGLELATPPAPAGHPRSVRAAARAFGRREGRGGHALAELRIPRIGLRDVVVGGSDPADLRRGPGFLTTTALPGLGATTAIAGHRTTYGAPFRHLDALRRGDPITLRLPYGTFRYAVEGHRIVDPGDLAVLRTLGRDRLVLSACHPLYSAARRIVVTARLRDIGQPARSLKRDT
jgi:sortase A